MSIDITKLEEKLELIINDGNHDTFLFSLLEAYNFPKSTVTLLKKDPTKLSKKSNEIILKNKVLFHVTTLGEDEHEVIDTLMHSKGVEVHKPRFLIVTDFTTFLAVDTKTSETLDIEFKRLPKHFDFFLPWIGREKYRGENESPADIKAATKMAKLFDQIINDNPEYARDHAHELNLFLTRLLFCFFAEDSEIFQDGLFSNSVGSYTSEDGSDFKAYIRSLFEVLNLDESKRRDIPSYLQAFPYVNGGLFEEEIKLPVFTAKSRRLIIEAGSLDWSEINPDIFGSMIQAVTHPGMREDLGMHYTSVSNILKVIEPLFLNELHEEFEKAGDNVNKLEKLRERIANIKIFDPACGSGNFLIISYKKLCELEIQIIEQIQSTGKNTLPLSGISLNNFYGIEIDDFAHEVARLSLWLAQHQMNKYFNDVFGMMKPTLPLKESGHIFCENAARLDWTNVLPSQNQRREDIELFIVGNPPYEGARKQKSMQKSDMEVVFKNNLSHYKNLDYIAIWFYKASQFIQTHSLSKAAFVSTNSICQGEQVAILWPYVIKNGVEICFAHKSFPWKNLAKRNAAVYCSIVGLAKSCERKFLYLEDQYIKADHINSYLIAAPEIYVYRRSSQISNLPKMNFGSMPNDSGFLILEQGEKDEMLALYPESKKYFKKLLGAVELTNSTYRWCLWISEKEVDSAMKIDPIRKRIDQVRGYRLASERGATRKLASTPYAFGENRYKQEIAIVIPSATSSRRDYIPLAVVDSDTVPTNRTHVVYSSEIYIMGILSSKMHVLWVKTIGGRLKNDYLYSSSVCYNTFPFPEVSDEQKSWVTEHVYNILDEREKHPEKTLSELYDPEKMPLGLRKAHEFLDEVIDRIYQKKPFESDEERLACLFKLYERMLADEQEK